MKTAKKLERPRAKAFGPVIELYESEWRWLGEYEPPIHWGAVPGFLLACAIMLWFACWRSVSEGRIDPGWLWILFPSEWNLTSLL